MPEFYYAPLSPNCRSVMMAMKAAGVEGVDMKLVDMQNAEHKSESYMKMNPAGTVPTLADGEFYLGESRPMMSYLVGKYGKPEKASVYPKDPKERALVDRFMFFDMGTLQPALFAYGGPLLFGDGKVDEEKKKALDEVLQKMDGYLAGGQYIAGSNATIADFCCGATLSMVMAEGHEYDLPPNVKSWYEKLQKLPYFDECNKTGMDMIAGMLAQKK